MGRGAGPYGLGGGFNRSSSRSTSVGDACTALGRPRGRPICQADLVSAILAHMARVILAASRFPRGQGSTCTAPRVRKVLARRLGFPASWLRFMRVVKPVAVPVPPSRRGR